ncbi:pyroglutamyl-peptidase I [Acidaminobacter sp. JC074]|uniref:pyroglutamyl-peptidase I n=1 Tax=Acidaminobacter sp. JC074 TaxID=2530199 RepID=UPI001F0ECE59|nr:pyroglutamyl-peptidase I [Acidaminobacter sp. JC074]MCH4886167.1 pyroglutamyl-peptidase I [Acidaminobacter sp. JC074]
MKALVTGFDPFGGEKINPAYEAVKRMKDKIGECEVIKLEIPTVFNKSLELLESAIEKEKPDFVICVGQAGGRFGMSLEKVGINLNEARIPDNEGNQPLNEKIKEDGETAYFSSLPNKAIVKTMKDSFVPAEVSYTAGTYVCNHVLYGLMYMIDKKYPEIRGGFIHVPFLPQQAIDKRNAPYMDLESIIKGLEIAVEVTATNKEDLEIHDGQTH